MNDLEWLFSYKMRFRASASERLNVRNEHFNST